MCCEGDKKSALENCSTILVVQASLLGTVDHDLLYGMFGDPLPDRSHLYSDDLLPDISI